MLYRVRIGQDAYLGSADEVVAFLARTEGAPGRDARSYMEGVAKRLRERLGKEGIRTSDARAFLESLAASGVIVVETQPEPSDERVDPRETLGDGPIAYGKGVDPRDIEVG
jgi:hypothetical protein